MSVNAGGQTIVGVVTYPGEDEGSPENQDQPYGTEHARAAELATDTPVRSEEAGWPALSEAESQGAEPVQVARRRTRQRRSQR